LADLDQNDQAEKFDPNSSPKYKNKNKVRSKLIEEATLIEQKNK